MMSAASRAVSPGLSALLRWSARASRVCVVSGELGPEAYARASAKYGITWL
jgi:hypothetical protein